MEVKQLAFLSTWQKVGFLAFFCELIKSFMWPQNMNALKIIAIFSTFFGTSYLVEKNIFNWNCSCHCRFLKSNLQLMTFRGARISDTFFSQREIRTFKKNYHKKVLLKISQCLFFLSKENNSVNCDIISFSILSTFLTYEKIYYLFR